MHELGQELTQLYGECSNNSCYIYQIIQPTIDHLHNAERSDNSIGRVQELVRAKCEELSLALLMITSACAEVKTRYQRLRRIRQDIDSQSPGYSPIKAMNFSEEDFEAMRPMLIADIDLYHGLSMAMGICHQQSSDADGAAANQLLIRAIDQRLNKFNRLVSALLQADSWLKSFLAGQPSKELDSVDANLQLLVRLSLMCVQLQAVFIDLKNG